MTALPGRSVLIVEDEGIFAEDLQQSLVGMGYDAFAIAASADEALACVTTRCPDVILMDVRLEGRHDGIAAAALLRALHDVPIVYLTAHADDDTIARAKLTMPGGYLVKPVASGELQSAIELSLHRHAALRKQRDLEQRLELADRLAGLGTLTAGLAHEINNPLAAMIANAEYSHSEVGELAGLLAAGSQAAPAFIERFAELSQRQSEIVSAGLRIGRIVADLKEFSRPPEPIPDTADVGCAIRWAVRATVHEFRRRARLVHHPARLPPVRADEARLRQVFVNLLKNAAGSIAPGRIAEHEVAIAARLDREHIVIEVSDDGTGIAPEHLARVFEPFFTTRPIGEGTGLGLAVCHGIVTSLGGEIQVESQLGRGTTFRVVLPVADDAGSGGFAPGPAPLPARILVVDPDTMLHRTMRRLLRDHDVVCVASAPEALARIDDGEDFDVIFAELLMPVMTGIELYHRARASDPQLADRIVFVTSGVYATASAEQFLRSVSNLTLEKPFGQPELDSVIALMLAERSAA